jgi:prevent-host-death family protein
MAIYQSTEAVIAATEVRRNFGDVIRRVYSGNEHIVVEKDGLPVAVILSLPEYEAIRKEQKLRRFESLARRIGEDIEARGLTEEDVDQQVEAVRQRMYDTNP